MSDGRRSAILRAEILRGASTEITCALEITEESVFIVTEGLPSIGDMVTLRLSFPRTVRPLVVSASVVQVRMSSGPGTPPGFVADFAIDGEDAREKMAHFVRRVRPNGSGPPSVESGARRIQPPRELSVLLIEDNQLIVDMFAYAVERYFSKRCGVVLLSQAASVPEAWRVLDAKRSFDLALVDHVLPGETGASFIAKLRSHGTFRRMAIVGMSVGGSDVRRAMLEAGADIFLHKPIVLKDLFCTLEFLMEAPESDRGAA